MTDMDIALEHWRLQKLQIEADEKYLNLIGAGLPARYRRPHMACTDFNEDANTRDWKQVKDSGKRQSFDTGAVRDTEEGKPRLDLMFKYLPMTALMRVTQHYVNGAKKYGDHNWQKGIPSSRCISSAFRHLYQYFTGDRSEDHLSAVIFNIFAIIHWEETGNLKMQEAPCPPIKKPHLGLCAGEKHHLVDLSQKLSSRTGDPNWYNCPVCAMFSDRGRSVDRWNEELELRTRTKN